MIDMICFTLDSAQHLVEALRGRVQHFLHCGTIWVHGPSVVVPTTEDQPRRPFGDYGIQKAQIEAYLLDEARRHGFPATILHPGHIVGPGWAPLNPAGHFNPRGLRSDWRAAKSWRCPTWAWRRCITSTPTTWPRRFVRAIGQLERGGGRELPRRLAGGADPARLRRVDGRLVWSRGAAALPALGGVARRRRRGRCRRRPGTTSRTARTAASTRRAAGWAMSRATARCRRFTSWSWHWSSGGSYPSRDLSRESCTSNHLDTNKENDHMDKPVLGIIVGNRGFFPDHLCESGRRTILKVVGRGRNRGGHSGCRKTRPSAAWKA